MKFELASVEQWNLGLSASAVAASLALETPEFATSLAAGALLEALNLGALRRSAMLFFDGQMTRSWSGAFALRFLFLAAGIFVTLQAGAHPVALLIGLSIAMPAVLIDAWLNRPPILDPATLPVLLDEDEVGDEAEQALRDERFSLAGPIAGSFTGRLFSTSFQQTGSQQTESGPAESRPTETRTTDAEAAADETRR